MITADNCFIHGENEFEKKSDSSLLEISVSCTSQIYDNVTTPYYPFLAQLVAYGRLKTKENFKLLAIKVLAVTYERWALTTGSKYSDLRGNFWVFRKLVDEEKWSQLEVRLYEEKLYRLPGLLCLPKCDNSC